MSSEDHDFIENLKNEEIHKYRFTLMPQNWINHDKKATLLWQRLVFDSSSIDSIPDSPGVYAFCLEPSISDNLNICYLMYIGMTNSGLKKRFKQYIAEETNPKGRKEIRKLIKLYKGNNHLYFYYATLSDDITNPEEVEKSLIASFLPPTNKRVSAVAQTKSAAF